MRRRTISRRAFITAASAAACARLVSDVCAAEPIIDIHQHTHYSGRSDEELLAHQRRLGVTKTVLLPAGSKYGLEADCYGNDSVLALTRRYPREFAFFANELPDIPEARRVIEKYLKLGAIGIGEQKFPVECDSKHIHLIAAIAQEHGVPVLLHFQHDKYNTEFARFHTVLEKFPKVNFIGHAQTWWGNIDRSLDQTVLYPKTKVTPGGLTDRWLSDYPNMYGDLSAGSGLNALLRDEDHAREFLRRHQDKLMYGSDCNDREGEGEKCSGATQLATLSRLVADKDTLGKILSGNARRVLKIR
ncbi:MAG TPA: amidohydrolase family protein [Blastocatellia bacterium]|nr:amidohydrolase family protein [Blastocatellia bacterium]